MITSALPELVSNQEEAQPENNSPKITIAGRYELSFLSFLQQEMHTIMNSFSGLVKPILSFF